MKKTWRGYGRLPKIGVGVLVAATAVSAVPGLASAAGGRPIGVGNGKGGGSGETTVANNLSNPVYFASNVGVLGLPNDNPLGPPATATWTGLRIPSGPGGTPTYNTSFDWNGTLVWPQALEGNSWQATWGTNTAPSTVQQPTVADWGDNILGTTTTLKSFALNTAIRVEIKLTPGGSNPVTSGFYQTMTSSGTGSSEKFAADKNSMTAFGNASQPSETVFTGGATMTLADITGGTTVRTFPVDTTFVSTTETETGGSTGGVAPMKLAGEINASGNVVYGLNLFPAQLGMQAGHTYQLTFSINPTFNDAAAGATGLPSGATLDGVVPLDLGTYRASYSTGTTSVQFTITSTQTGHRGGGGSGTGDNTGTGTGTRGSGGVRGGGVGRR